MTINSNTLKKTEQNDSKLRSVATASIKDKFQENSEEILILTEELREKSSIKWPHISKFQTVVSETPNNGSSNYLRVKCIVYSWINLRWGPY